MSVPHAEQLHFGPWQGSSIEIERVEDNLTRDGGLTGFSQLDRKPGSTSSFRELIDDYPGRALYSIERVGL